MRSLLYVGAVLGLVLGMGGIAQAGVIMLTTQESWEGGTGRVGELPDDQFINWVQGTLGHTVIKKVLASPLVAADFTAELTANNVDLVIIGPRNSSGNYTDKGLNAIPVPMLAMLPHAVRANRMNWLGTGDAGADNQAWTDVDLVLAAHAWVAGLGTTFYDYTSTGGNGDTRWYRDATDVGTGTVIARRGATDNSLAIVSWDAGDVLADGTPAGAARAMFMGTNWARAGADWEGSFDTNYTADGKTSLGRVINTMIPEPATLALLGLGVAATLLRRKK